MMDHLERRELQQERYEKAFYILIDVFDQLPEETRVEVHEKLVELDL